MSNFSGLKEKLKTLAIVLLVISAFFLGRATGLFNSFIMRNEGHTVQGSNTAAKPVYIALTNENGDHYAAKYDEQELTELYRRSRDVLREAIGSSEQPQEISSESWEEYLKCRGEFFDYYDAFPISVIAAWLDTTPKNNIHAVVRRFAVAQEGNEICLCYIDEESGKYYHCRTAAAVSDLCEALPNGAQFGFESEYKDCDPYMIILGELPEIRAAVLEKKTVDSENLLLALGMNSYLRPYTESGGTKVFVESTSNLRIYEGGTAVFKSIESIEPKELTDAEAIELARGLAAGTVGEGCGEAELRCAGISLENREYTVIFDYFLNGIRIGRAAEIKIKEGIVSGAELYFRSYSQEEEALTLLPEKQAVAIAQSMEKGTEITLAYTELLPKWVLR